MDLLVRALVEYPILTLFVVIGLGYVFGEISFFGFRFGVAGVLFVGLAVGSLGPDVALPDVIATLGLIIFVYTIGIYSGKAFFASFQKQGYRDSLFVVAMLAFGSVVTLILAYLLGIGGPRAAGLYCGALTNTPALAAARETVRELALRRNTPADEVQLLAGEPVVAYGLAYPVGVVGMLLCFQLFRKVWKIDFEGADESKDILVRDFVVRNPGIAGKTVGDVLRLHRHHGFVVSRIQKQNVTDIARSETRLEFGDVVAVVGDDEALERAQHIFGEPSPTHIELDRTELDYRRVFVSEKSVVGRRIRDLDLQNRLGATITRLRRGDVDIVPDPDTRLEFGDRIRVLTRRANFSLVSRFFGDSIRGTAEADFGSVSLGMVLGVMLGMLPIPLPGGTVVRLGLAGGPLLVALVLGKIEYTGRITWTMPVSANLTLRHIGLLLFMAGVGTRAGFGFAETMRTTGPQLILAGAVVTFSVTLLTLIAGHKLLKMPYDALMGLASGLQTQPACLAFANNMAKSDVPNVSYASVYPAAMIAKILLAQMLVALGR